jgi:hypothetical protein
VPAQQRLRGLPAGSFAAVWGAGRARRASTIRSAQSTWGLRFCRRSTATSWRRTSSSASFDAGQRASSAIHPVRRMRSGTASVWSRACYPASPAAIMAGIPAGQPPMSRFGTTQRRDMLRGHGSPSLAAPPAMNPRSYRCGFPDHLPSILKPFTRRLHPAGRSSRSMSILRACPAASQAICCLPRGPATDTVRIAG